MSHQLYLEEINKKAKRAAVYWLVLIVVICFAIISLLVIIRKETNFFVTVQESKDNLSNEEKMEIQGRVLASWAKRDLGFEEKQGFESRVLGSEIGSLSAEEKMNVEERLIQ